MTRTGRAAIYEAPNTPFVIKAYPVRMMPRPLPGGGTGVPKESLERAELNLEAATRLAPDNLEAHHELAILRETLGKRGQAREAWTKVRDLAAGKPEHARLTAQAVDALARLER